MQKMIGVLAVVAVATLGLTAPASAETVSFDPQSQLVGVGDTFNVDLVVSGLTDPIGSFKAVITFNAAVLVGVSYLLDPDGGFDSPDDASLGFLGNTLDLFLSGDPLDQGPGFRLATITFQASAVGLSGLLLSDVELGELIPTMTNGGVVVCRTTPSDLAEDCEDDEIPEPAILALFGAGLAGLAARRRKAAARA